MIRFGLVCCLLSLAATATAQDHSPLFADRPDFTESAAITDRGRIRFEGGWTAQGDDRLGAEAGVDLRAGVGLVEASSDWLCAVEFTQEWVP